MPKLVLVLCLLALLGCEGLGAVLQVGSAQLRVGSGTKLLYHGREAWAQPQPAALELVESDGSSRWLSAAYDSATASESKITCKATISSPNGTQFAFTDTYSVSGPAFVLRRQVAILHPSAKDAAFGTRFSISSTSTADLEDYDVLAPGVWYGHNDGVGKHAIGGDYADNAFLVREDRLAAPFVMARARSGGLSLCIADGAPDGGTYNGEDFLPRIVDERLQFASIGIFRRAGKGIDLSFQFPGSEGEKTYIEGSSPKKRWAYRSHPVRAGVRHSYTIILLLAKSPGFPTAVRDTWRWAYRSYKPAVTPCDLSKIYSNNLDLLARYAKTVNDAPGLPFSIDLDGKAGDYNYLMGFVGGQIAAAYHLYRSNAPEHQKVGESIIDFWVKNSYDGRTDPNALPHTWYQPRLPEEWDTGPHWGQSGTERFWRDEPQHGQVFLRTLCEGHMAALRAWELAENRKTHRQDWLTWCKRFGSWLSNHQNPDGSFCRKYATNGDAIDHSGNNTCSAVEYLAGLYRYTGDARYLNAALRAGAYAWQHVHIPAHYAGGTNDNPNVLDKEAALIDLRAFLALYDVTHDAKWLMAARQAADFAETWVYIWNVPLPVGSTGAAKLDGISTVGLSLVATGHSYADCFDASAAFDYWRLWQLTGDTHYRDFAALLFYNTKQLLDTDGSRGYAHPGLQVEGLGMSVVRGSGPRVWLPWISIAHMDPISQLTDSGQMNELANLYPQRVAH